MQNGSGLMRATALLLSATLLGCGGSDKSVTKKVSATSRPTAPVKPTPPRILDQVPAETPYIYAVLDPLPDAVTDRMFDGPTLEQALTRLEGELAAAKGGDWDADLGYAIVKELRGKMSRAGVEQLGLTTRPRLVVYGHGLYPALRVSLSSGARLRATIARIIANVPGLEVPERQISGKRYWFIEDEIEGIDFAIAITGNELVIGAFPARHHDRVVKLMLGIERPAQSLGASGRLERLRTRIRSTPSGVGYIDLLSLAQIVTGQATGLNGALFDAASLGISPGCSHDLVAAARVFPRITIGTPTINAKEWTATMGLETRADIVAAFQRMRAPIPGGAYRHAKKPKLAIGLGLQLDHLLELFAQTATSLAARKSTCKAMAKLPAALAPLPAQLRTLKNLVAGVSGMSVVINAFDLPHNVEGAILLAAAKPAALLARIAGIAPILARTGLRPGAPPVRVPLPKPLQGDAYVGMSSIGLGIAVGPRAESVVTGALQGAALSGDALLRVRLDRDWTEKLQQQGKKPATDPTAWLERALSTPVKYHEFRMSLGLDSRGFVLTASQRYQ